MDKNIKGPVTTAFTFDNGEPGFMIKDIIELYNKTAKDNKKDTIGTGDVADRLFDMIDRSILPREQYHTGFQYNVNSKEESVWIDATLMMRLLSYYDPCIGITVITHYNLVKSDGIRYMLSRDLYDLIVKEYNRQGTGLPDEFSYKAMCDHIKVTVSRQPYTMDYCTDYKVANMKMCFNTCVLVASTLVEEVSVEVLKTLQKKFDI